MFGNATPSKFASDRPFADPEAAARELLRIYKKFIEESKYGDPFTQTGITNAEFIYRRGGSPEEYAAGRDYGVERRWFELFAGRSRVRILPAGEEILGTI